MNIDPRLEKVKFPGKDPIEKLLENVAVLRKGPSERNAFLTKGIRRKYG